MNEIRWFHIGSGVQRILGSMNSSRRTQWVGLGFPVQDSHRVVSAEARVSPAEEFEWAATVRVDELLCAIRAVASGNFVLSPAIAESLSQRELRKGREPVQLLEEQVRAVQHLSRREREVFELMVDGYSNPEIADAFYIAQQTVKNHITSIYSKIGVHSRRSIEREGQ